jgi:hypothetical protein
MMEPNRPSPLFATTGSFSGACGVSVLIESGVSGGLLADVEIWAGAPFGRRAMSTRFFLQKPYRRPDFQECR